MTSMLQDDLTTKAIEDTIELQKKAIELASNFGTMIVAIRERWAGQSSWVWRRSYDRVIKLRYEIQVLMNQRGLI